MPPRNAVRGILRPLLCLFLGVGLAACGTTFDTSKKIDYKSANKLPPLEVPPDLTRPGTDDRYVVPDVNPKSTATFSEYSRERTGQRPGAGTAVLPQLDSARVVRDGSQRWLVVKGEPAQVWPVVKEFWQESGFIVNLESPESGVMETDWAENRARLENIGAIRGFLSRFLDQVFSTSERDKFRTRLERGTEPGTTEIYVSHRGMEEVVVGSSTSDVPDTRWQPRPPDPNIEAEMLGRLMTRFGVEQVRVKAELATAAPAQQRATLQKGTDGTRTLTLDEQFDRAWRRVGLALDRVGFTVEDRDRSKGLYFVRYIDPQIDSKTSEKGGWLSWLKFWGSDKPKTEQFRIEVRDDTKGCQVKVLNKDGAQESTETAGKILTLLYDQLK